MIVLDVGAVPWGREESVGPLIERFAPRLLLAFDPHPEMVEGFEVHGDTLVVGRRAAAWTHGGSILVRLNKIITAPAMDRIRPYEEVVEVDCFDLCELINALPASEGIVLKLDCEGSEYPLLNALAEKGLDTKLELVLVEWHTGIYAHGMETRRPQLSCPLELWDAPTRPPPSPRGPTDAILRQV